VTFSNFHTEVTQTLGASVPNLVATVANFPQVLYRWLQAQPTLPAVYRGLSTRYHAQKYVCFLHSRTYIAQIKARFMREFRIPFFFDPTFREIETSVKNYHHTLRNIAEERRSQARFKLAWQLEVCRLNKQTKNSRMFYNLEDGKCAKADSLLRIHFIHFVTVTHQNKLRFHIQFSSPHFNRLGRYARPIIKVRQIRIYTGTVRHNYTNNQQANRKCVR
jgi:hypothetical protein